MMPFTWPLAGLAAKVLGARFARVLRDQEAPVQAQERAYRALRAALRGTEIARTNRLDEAGDLAAFARTVPPRGYDELAEAVARSVDRGERGVLFHGRPEFVGLSSGSMGQAKRIVHDRASLAAFGDWEFALGAIILRAGVNPVVSDRLVWGISPPESTRSGSGVEEGYLSGFLASRSRWILRRRTVPSPAVGRMADLPRKVQAAAPELRGRDIRIASAVPSYLLHLLEELRALWGVADLGAIWPHLDVVLYSGTPIDCFREPLVALLGRRPRFLGMYLATECPLGYEIAELAGEGNGRYSFHFGATVFTFRRLTGDGAVLTIGELAPGDEVELLVSGPHGLLNYRIGDCLKIRSTKPILFEVMGRVGHGLNLATEKVTLGQLNQAAARVSQPAAGALRHFFVCPGRSERGRPCYEWTLLFDRPEAVDRGAALAALERALGEENDYYKESRDGDSLLDPPRLNVLSSAVARRYFERDAHRGQLKMKTAFDSRAALVELLRGLGADLDGGDGT